MNQGPLELTADILKNLEGVAARAVLRSHASGLRAAAGLVAELADELAKTQMALDEKDKENVEDFEDLRMRKAELKAKSEVLIRLNDQLMARIKNVDVLLGQE